NKINAECSEVRQTSADKINAIAFPETGLFDLAHLAWNRISNEPAVQARPDLSLCRRRRATAFALGAPDAQAGVHRVPGPLRGRLGNAAVGCLVLRRRALGGRIILVARRRDFA